MKTVKTALFLLLIFTVSTNIIHTSTEGEWILNLNSNPKLEINEIEWYAKLLIEFGYIEQALDISDDKLLQSHEKESIISSAIYYLRDISNIRLKQLDRIYNSLRSLYYDHYEGSERSRILYFFSELGWMYHNTGCPAKAQELLEFTEKKAQVPGKSSCGLSYHNVMENLSSIYFAYTKMKMPENAQKILFESHKLATELSSESLFDDFYFCYIRQFRFLKQSKQLAELYRSYIRDVKQIQSRDLLILSLFITPLNQLGEEELAFQALKAYVSFSIKVDRFRSPDTPFCDELDTRLWDMIQQIRRFNFSQKHHIDAIILQLKRLIKKHTNTLIASACYMALIDLYLKSNQDQKAAEILALYEKKECASKCLNSLKKYYTDVCYSNGRAIDIEALLAISNFGEKLELTLEAADFYGSIGKLKKSKQYLSLLEKLIESDQYKHRRVMALLDLTQIGLLLWKLNETEELARLTPKLKSSEDKNECRRWQIDNQLSKDNINAARQVLKEIDDPTARAIAYIYFADYFQRRNRRKKTSYFFGKALECLIKSKVVKRKFLSEFYRVFVYRKSKEQDRYKPRFVMIGYGADTEWSMIRFLQ